MKRYKTPTDGILFIALLVLFLPSISSAVTPVLGSKSAGMGTAFTAVSDDASAIAHNPAGLTQLKGNNIYGGIGLFFPHSSYESPSGQSENTDFLIYFPPHIYVASELNKKDLCFGVGIYSPFGVGGKKWDADGATRYSSVENLIATVAINPTVAWQVLPSLSIGAGIQYMYTLMSSERKIDQSVVSAGDGISTMKSDGGGWGYNVGLLYKPVEQLSLGLTYRSKINVDCDGDIRLEHIAPALQALFGGSRFKTDMNTSLTFPDSISFGIAYRPSEKILVAADIERTMWSSFDSMDIDLQHQVTAAGFTDSSAPLDCKDLWRFAIGAEHKYTDTISLRGGYAYVETAVPDHTIDPAFTDADSHNIFLGLGYKKDRYVFDCSYVASFYQDRTVKNPVLSGDYGNFAQYISFSVGKRF